MHFKTLFICLFSLAVLVLGTAAHSLRNGVAMNPHQIDTPVFSQKSIDLKDFSGIFDNNLLTLGLASQGQIPKVKAGDHLDIVNPQVNDDGAGPFRCRIDQTGTGASYSSPLTVIKPVSGSSLKVKIPNDVKCKGKSGNVKNVCIMRCENNAPNGPFGGSIPFELE